MEHMIKAVRLAAKIRPKAIPVKLLSVVLRALEPYFPLYCAGRLTNALLAAEPDAAWCFAALMIISAFLLSILISLCDKAWEYEGKMLDWEMRGYLAQKEMRVPYIDHVSSGLRSQYRKIRTERDTGGFDFSYIIEDLAEIMGKVVSFAAANVSFLVLARMKGAVESMSWVDSIWIAAALLGIMAIILYRIYQVIGRIGTRYFENMSALYDLDGILWYYDRSYLDASETGRDVRIFGQEDLIDRSYQASMEASIKLARKMSWAQGGGTGVSSALGWLLCELLASFVVLKAVNGAVGIGMIITYIGIAQMLCKTVERLSFHLTNLRKAAAFLDASFAILETPEEDGRGIVPQSSGHTIEFSHVSYRYPATTKNALDDVSFILREGSCTALVGCNGSGKSTAVALLCRLIKPVEGTITLDGIDIQCYDAEEYRKLLAAVFQDFQMISAPIGENIACSQQHGKIDEILHRAGLGNRFDGMEAVVLERQADPDGIDVSGGEKQKLAIARALYRNAPVVILDEPTSALDPLSEQAIFERMRDMTYGKTTIFISHRLSSCTFCDTVLVLKDGKLVQQGTHQVLVEQPGEYQRLWMLQAQFYM